MKCAPFPLVKPLQDCEGWSMVAVAMRSYNFKSNAGVRFFHISSNVTNLLHKTQWLEPYQQSDDKIRNTPSWCMLLDRFNWNACCLLREGEISTKHYLLGIICIFILFPGTGMAGVICQVEKSDTASSAVGRAPETLVSLASSICSCWGSMCDVMCYRLHAALWERWFESLLKGFAWCCTANNNTMARRHSITSRLHDSELSKDMGCRSLSLMRRWDDRIGSYTNTTLMFRAATVFDTLVMSLTQRHHHPG